MTTALGYPRDLVGHGRNPPRVVWPGNARIAVQIVLNYEEGGENCVLHGDAASEAFLSEIVGAQPWAGQRHMNMESIYEYGARAGFWRLWRLFTARNIPVTVYGVATALQRAPAIAAAMREAGWEIASHGYKWIEYRDFTAADEREHLRQAIRLHREVTGERPTGWYLGRCSEHTTQLVMEEGGFLYSSDSYADDLPYWIEGPHGPHLIVPYTLDANDMRFATTQGFNAGDQFFNYLKDSFDVLYAEGGDVPKMLSIGLHCRLIGRPGRVAALMRFLDYIASHPQVWMARRIDIARHWVRHHPPAEGLRPSRMPRALFVECFGDVFDHSPEIAEAAHRAGLSSRDDTAEGLHATLTAAMRELPVARKRALIDAHPDLAGRLALAGVLTADSRREQSGAGLDTLTPAELAEFTALNGAYRARFGFPFILAVQGYGKAEILAIFKTRLGNDPEAEFNEALRQIERIVLLRLKARLP